MFFRKAAILFICAVFCFCALVYGPALFFLQQYARHEMKDFIANAKDLNKNTLTLNENEFKKITWLEDDELIYKGSLYDLITIINNVNGTRKLIVLEDDKEELILVELCNYSIKNLPINKATLQLFKILTCFNDNYFPSIKFKKTISTPKTKHIKNNLVCLFFSDILIPPPKQV